MITGESNFDEKNVEEVFNLCSTEQSCIDIGITCYKIGTLTQKTKKMLQLHMYFPEGLENTLFQKKLICTSPSNSSETLKNIFIFSR